MVQKKYCAISASAFPLLAIDVYFSVGEQGRRGVDCYRGARRGAAGETLIYEAFLCGRVGSSKASRGSLYAAF